MLLTATPVIPTGPDWSYEVKWDGYRCLTTFQGGVVDFRARNGTLMDDWFPSLAAVAHCVKGNCVLDGDVVTLDADGKPDFWRTRSGTPTFVAFEVLQADGGNVTGLPLAERRTIVRGLATACRY